MNTSRALQRTLAYAHTMAARGVRAFYSLCIEPKRIDEDARRRELIFNVIATSLFLLICLLDVSILYADLTHIAKDGFGFFTFTLFVTFFGSLIYLSRKGHVETAMYLFVGLYFMATTYGIYAWGTAVPLSLLSYGAIIVMTSILLGTRTGAIAAVTVSATLITIGFLETRGMIRADIAWRLKPLEFKDTLEDSFVYGMIATVSWLSNRELERSLVKARLSENSLKHERDMLEVRIEERTQKLKAVELEKISQLYRFVEFGRLASGIFHDLLNPLAVVSLSVERLDDKDDQNAIEARSHIDRAIRASKRMETFLQTAKKQLDSKERNHAFSARSEISDAVDLLRHKSHRAGVEINFSDDQDMMIQGNPVKYFQIAVNLISNAIDSYTGKSGSIENTVRVALISSKENALLTVADSGCGVPEDIRALIFEPFFTTKHDMPRHESGFGLGLSTTKDIVEKDFNGEVLLESEVGKGSTFTVSIPISRQTTAITPDGIESINQPDDRTSALRA